MSDTLVKATARFNEGEVGGEIVVMNLDNGDIFSLTGTALAIWRLIDGSRDRDAILAVLAAEFGKEPGAIAGELDEFVAQLDDAGLLERS